MVRRSLLLGVLVSLAVLLLVSANEHWETMLIVFAVGLVLASLEIAYSTSCAATFYGASGMVAGMAAMMAAMGTGLAAGYATGMIWSLGWANLFGVVVGFGHGLLMGRRFGPMAALDGAGGGVMGGLMGPMLGVMLLYQPTGLVLTAILMLGLQAIFSVGGVYLVAEAAGAVGESGPLYQVGRVLGAHDLTGPPEGVCSIGAGSARANGSAPTESSFTVSTEHLAANSPTASLLRTGPSGGPGRGYRIGNGLRQCGPPRGGKPQLIRHPSRQLRGCSKRRASCGHSWFRWRAAGADDSPVPTL